MASGKLYNLAKMNTATTGTGTITLSTAVSGFLSFATSGVANGESVTYIIEDGANRELGVGVYTTSGTTLTRSVLRSTNSNNPISLSGSATVGITAAAENFTEWNAAFDANGFSIGFDDNTGVNDDSGNETLRFRKTTSAVNYVEVLNTATGTGPSISSAGDDANINLDLVAKGTGVVRADGVEVVTLTGVQTLTNKSLTAPNLGTPAAGTLTNCAGLPLSGVVDSTTEALGVGTLEVGHASDTTLSRAAAGVLAVEGVELIKASGNQTLTGGFVANAFDAGTLSSGTYTPAPSDGNMQRAVNGGAHTLAPPTSNCTIIIQYTNNASAGAITTSGFTIVTGVTPTTVNGDDFLAYITRLNGFSHLNWQPLQ